MIVKSVTFQHLVTFGQDDVHVTILIFKKVRPSAAYLSKVNFEYESKKKGFTEKKENNKKNRIFKKCMHYTF